MFFFFLVIFLFSYYFIIYLLLYAPRAVFSAPDADPTAPRAENKFKKKYFFTVLFLRTKKHSYFCKEKFNDLWQI